MTTSLSTVRTAGLALIHTVIASDTRLEFSIFRHCRQAEFADNPKEMPPETPVSGDTEQME